MTLASPNLEDGFLRPHPLNPLRPSHPISVELEGPPVIVHDWEGRPGNDRMPSTPFERRSGKGSSMKRLVPRSGRDSSAVLRAAMVLALAVPAAKAQDTWDAVYLSGSKIGHVHTWVEKVSDKNHEYNRVRIDAEMRLKRGQDESVVKLMYGTIETLDGQVLRLDTRTDAGGNQDIRVHGDVIGGRMKLSMKAGGQSVSQTIPWSPEIRGPYGPEQSMTKQPMKAGESRQIRVYIPELNKVCDQTLIAKSLEPTVLGDGSKRDLLRVDLTTEVDGKHRPEYDSRVFVDPKGQVLKSEQDIMGGMVYYRTSREAALAPAGSVRFNMIAETMVKVPRPISNPDQTRQVRYRVTLKKQDPSQVFPIDARQSVKKEEGATNSAIVEIRSVGPIDGTPIGGEISPQYLQPNALINSDDIRVRSLASEITRGIVDPWEKARAINGWVYEKIRQKDFKVAFASAADVARNLQGDCSEHSVLAAAICRASGIPSRVVVGLIYVEDAGGFGYHMWDEVFVNSRWIAIDPSWNQTTVDAVHIKLSDSSLDGVAPFEAFLPVALVEGQLAIEPIEVR